MEQKIGMIRRKMQKTYWPKFDLLNNLTKSVGPLSLRGRFIFLLICLGSLCLFQPLEFAKGQIISLVVHAEVF